MIPVEMHRLVNSPVWLKMLRSCPTTSEVHGEIEDVIHDHKANQNTTEEIDFVDTGFEWFSFNNYFFFRHNVVSIPLLAY